MSDARRGIPVVMYHNVGSDYPGWVWNHLVTPLEVFEGQMRALKERGWTTISLAELHAHMAGGVPVPDKSVVLTFDDGYRDNWVYAFPVLKKYGHRGVIWMSTDFVDPRTEPALTLEDAWAGNVERRALDARGWLSWSEMRRMVSSGLVEIQSHAKTHTWYFSGPQIVDFHRPEGVEGYRTPIWLAWNAFPGEKHRTMHDRMEDRIPYGTPIYRHGKSFAVRRYFEDPALTERLVSFVAGEGGRGFFARAGWRARLEEIVSRFGAREDRIETEDERLRRIAAELADSRRAIEDALGGEVRFLCWPGGAHDPQLQRIAEEAGYLASTTAYGSRAKRNVHGENPAEINRIGSGSPWSWRGRIIRRTDPDFFITGLEMFRGGGNLIWKYRIYKLKYALRYCLTGAR